MATSGTFLFNPDLAEIVDEAFERCKVDPAKITQRHITSARRSMRFMLSDWATEDYHEWRIQQYTLTVVQGTATYTDPDIDPNILDILDAVLTRDGIDTPVLPWPRQSYLEIPDKTIEGRPDRWFIDKQRDGIVVTLWPVPENSTDVITFNAVRKFEDSDTAADNADIPFMAWNAFAAGLAARLCEKFGAPELEEKLFMKAAIALKKANNATRERGTVRLVPVGGGRRRRGSAGRYR